MSPWKAKQITLTVKLFFHSLLVGIIIISFPRPGVGDTNQYLMFPIPGHAVDITSLNETDKNYALFEELKKTRLILMEPGIRPNDSLKGWYTGNVFVIKSDSDIIHYGQVIEVDAGRFR